MRPSPSRRENSRLGRIAALIQISRLIDCRLIQRISSASASCIVARLTRRTRKMREAEKLRELATWYREFAERAGNPSIWESRLRMAEDLEREANDMLREHAGRKRRRRQALAFEAVTHATD